MARKLSPIEITQRYSEGHYTLSLYMFMYLLHYVLNLVSWNMFCSYMYFCLQLKRIVFLNTYHHRLRIESSFEVCTALYSFVQLSLRCAHY